MEELKEKYHKALNEISYERVNTILKSLEKNKSGYITSKDLKEDLEVIKIIHEISHLCQNKWDSRFKILWDSDISIYERLDKIENVINKIISDSSTKIRYLSLKKEIDAIKNKITSMEKKVRK
jgi:hypothetical protein